MSMIKMTVMRGWDIDMNLTLTRNAKSNYWLLALSGCVFLCLSACTAIFILFFNSVEQL